jgi:urease accessory protein
MRVGLAERIRNALPDAAASFSVSQLERALVCRYLGRQAQEGKQLFTRAWDVLRISLQSKSACLPRIWAT